MKAYGNGSSAFYACSGECAEGFCADRRHGAIYGPFMLQDERGRDLRLARDAEEASRWSQTCAYCGAGEVHP